MRRIVPFKLNDNMKKIFVVLVGLHFNILLSQSVSSDSLNIKYSKCENCLIFPDKFMLVEKTSLIDFSLISPEKQLDFLIGNWQLYYPGDTIAARESFKWFSKGKVMEANQEWISGWKAKSFFRYVSNQNRWQFQWITPDTSSLFSGGLSSDNMFVFYENEFEGGPNKLYFQYPAKYVFKNITKNSFMVEWYESNNNGDTYPILKWRLFYKRK